MVACEVQFEPYYEAIVILCLLQWFEVMSSFSPILLTISEGWTQMNCGSEVSASLGKGRYC